MYRKNTVSFEEAFGKPIEAVKHRDQPMTKQQAKFVKNGAPTIHMSGEYIITPPVKIAGTVEAPQNSSNLPRRTKTYNSGNIPAYHGRNPLSDKAQKERRILYKFHTKMELDKEAKFNKNNLDLITKHSYKQLPKGAN